MGTALWNVRDGHRGERMHADIGIAALQEIPAAERSQRQVPADQTYTPRDLRVDWIRDCTVNEGTLDIDAADTD